MKPYYEDSSVKLFHGDSRNVLESFPPCLRVNLMLTDPPYGIGFEYLSYNDTEANLESCIKAGVIPAMARADRSVVFSGVTMLWKYPPADWVLSYAWRTTAKYGAYGYNQWQPILVYGKDIEGFGSVNGVIKSDVLNFDGGGAVGAFSEYKGGIHPCPKPLPVIRRVIARLSNPGDSILDPFAGSGTTLVAAKEMGRKAIGIELEEAYCEEIAKRLQQEYLPLISQPKPVERERELL